MVGKKGYDPHMTEEGRGTPVSWSRMLDAKSGDQILSGVCQEDEHSGKFFSFILG